MACPEGQAGTHVLFGIRRILPRFHQELCAYIQSSHRTPRHWKRVELGRHRGRSVNTIKAALTSDPIISLPNDDGLFVLDTDASNVAMGGILHQWQKDKDGTDRLKVICYGSKTLSRAQRNYAAPKLEMLAALTFIEKYANCLLGRKFVLRVDHKALEWILTMGMHNNPLAMRWVTRLQEFLFEVQHRKREKHTTRTEYRR